MKREIFMERLWGKHTRPKHVSMEEMAKTEWSPKFEELQRNRLIVGGYRYGRLNAPNKPKYNRISAIEQKIRLYQIQGNDELLVDIANLCMLEFEEGIHKRKHFHSEDDTDHVEKI